MVCPTLLTSGQFLLFHIHKGTGKKDHPVAPSSHFARSLNHYRKQKSQAKPFVSVFATSAVPITQQCCSAGRAGGPSWGSDVQLAGSWHSGEQHQLQQAFSKFTQPVLRLPHRDLGKSTASGPIWGTEINTARTLLAGNAS